MFFLEVSMELNKLLIIMYTLAILLLLFWYCCCYAGEYSEYGFGFRSEYFDLRVFSNYEVKTNEQIITKVDIVYYKDLYVEKIKIICWNNKGSEIFRKTLLSNEYVSKLTTQVFTIKMMIPYETFIYCKLMIKFTDGIKILSRKLAIINISLIPCKTYEFYFVLTKVRELTYNELLNKYVNLRSSYDKLYSKYINLENRYKQLLNNYVQMHETCSKTIQKLEEQVNQYFIALVVAILSSIVLISLLLYKCFGKK